MLGSSTGVKTRLNRNEKLDCRLLTQEDQKMNEIIWIGSRSGVSLKSMLCNLKTAIVVSAVLLAISVSAQAQQPTKVPRIGYVGPLTTDPRTASFRQGLRDLGYSEEKNILVEYRYVGGKVDRFPDVVAELVQLKVDVIVAVPFQAILAAKQATKTIPIVIVTTLDPVATGIVDSLARPGGNITGLARLTRELGGKRLELIKEAAPKVSRVGVLWAADDEGSAIGFKDYETAARAVNMSLQSLGVRGPNLIWKVHL